MSRQRLFLLGIIILKYRRWTHTNIRKTPVAVALPSIQFSPSLVCVRAHVRQKGAFKWVEIFWQIVKPQMRGAAGQSKSVPCHITQHCNTALATTAWYKHLLPLPGVRYLNTLFRVSVASSGPQTKTLTSTFHFLPRYKRKQAERGCTFTQSRYTEVNFRPAYI